MSIFRMINNKIVIFIIYVFVFSINQHVVNAMPINEGKSKLKQNKLNNINKTRIIAKAYVNTLQIENDEPSIAEIYINKETRYIEENEKIYCQMDVLALDWMKDIVIKINGDSVPYTKDENKKTKVMGIDHIGGTLKFEVPNINTNLTINTYIEPMKSHVTFKVVGEKVINIKEKIQNTYKVNNIDKNLKSINDNKKNVEQFKVHKNNKIEEIKSNEKVYKNTNLKKEKEGIYEINIKPLKQNNNEFLKVSDYIGDKIKIQIKDGKKYAIVTFKNITHNELQVLLNNKLEKYDVININTNSKKDKLLTVKFEIPNLECEIKFKVSDKKTHSQIVNFGILLEKSSLKFLEGIEYDPVKAEEYLNKLSENCIGNKQKENLQSFNDNNNQNQELLSESKSYKTKVPIGGSLIASVGGGLSCLGFALMKNNKKKGE